MSVSLSDETEPDGDSGAQRQEFNDGDHELAALGWVRAFWSTRKSACIVRVLGVTGGRGIELGKQPWRTEVRRAKIQKLAMAI